MEKFDFILWWLDKQDPDNVGTFIGLYLLISMIVGFFTGMATGIILYGFLVTLFLFSPLIILFGYALVKQYHKRYKQYLSEKNKL